MSFKQVSLSLVILLITSVSYGKCSLDSNDSKELLQKKSFNSTLKTGCIKGDCINGTGTYNAKNGEQYVGEWKDGKKEGQGSMTWVDNYERVFKNGKPTGKRTCFYEEGSKYVGEWKNDKREGQGIYSFMDGREYVGEWKKGKQEGQGVFTWIDESKYVGEFKNNEKDGQGTYYMPNGDVEAGRWQYGQYLGK